MSRSSSRRLRRAYLAAALLPALALVSLAAPAEEFPIEIREIQALGGSRGGGRLTFPQEPVMEPIIAGEPASALLAIRIQRDSDTATAWEKIVAGEDGWFEGEALVSGYAYAAVECAEDRIAVLEASGHGVVWVNGVPRGGDRYADGYIRLPVALRAGANELLFSTGRGRLKARLVAPRAALELDARDATLPDFVVGESASALAAVVVLNNANETAAPSTLVALDAQGREVGRAALPPMPPLTARKASFRLELPDSPEESGEIALTLRIVAGAPDDVAADAESIDEIELKIQVRDIFARRNRTFESDIDGTVQYYAEVPPNGGDAWSDKALVLTLHGASVQASGQADAYSPKSWAWIVAPTNRRPFGFDWEDWGRIDALEVLDLALARTGAKRDRVYLTGHSMGGHGTWHFGALRPDRFAAIGPSAGWQSFFTYAGGLPLSSKSPLGRMLRRAVSPSDSAAFLRNLAPLGVYVLHGDADDNVPVEEARGLRELLAPFHSAVEWHEQPGAGHWWDGDDEPGAACVDWRPMFEMFSRRRVPSADEVRRVQFATPHPGVSAGAWWATIESAKRAFETSRIDIQFDPGLRKFHGTTENVERLTLNLERIAPGKPLTIDLDGAGPGEVAWPELETVVHLVRKGEAWSVEEAPSPGLKNSKRSGPFRDAFNHRALLVYGTAGDDEDDALNLALARFHGEQFWQQGNGSFDTIPDFAYDAPTYADRNVVLYGNADTNGAWAELLADSPVLVSNGKIAMGGRSFEGDDLACLFVRPRADSDRDLVGAVAATGPSGMRSIATINLFLAGTGLPDLAIFDARSGLPGDERLLGAGFFGNDWSFASGDFAWRD
jgi:poly(3-hydroxybutyrate) depolymerase